MIVYVWCDNQSVCAHSFLNRLLASHDMTCIINLDTSVKYVMLVKCELA